MTETQADLNGETAQFGRLDTDGREIRRISGPVAKLVHEYRLEVTDNELYARAIDPANVAIVEVRKQVDVPDVAVMGISAPLFKEAISGARYGKRSKDPVSIRFGKPQSAVEITREYANDTVEYSNEFDVIDPDSLRQEPDVELFPFTSNVVSVDLDAFRDVIERADNAGDHIELTARDGALVVESGDDNSSFAATLEPGRDSHITAPESATYTLDYFTDMVEGLGMARVDTVTLCWSEEHPITMIAQDPEYRLDYHLAPRISDD